MADKSTSIAAVCPICGTSRFHASGETLQPADVLTCESCGLKLSYAFIQQRMQEKTEVRQKPAAKKRKSPRQ